MIDRDLNDDPATAISSCKNLIESQCKIVLTDLGVEFLSEMSFPGCSRRLRSSLNINANAVEGDSRGSDALRKAMRALTTTVQSIAESRIHR